MITAKEINSFSEKLGVPTATIDKDWVLGHLLSGIFNNAYFQEHLIFKGGTCLKKCYFENYRFSEDLDFTSIHIEKKKSDQTLKKLHRKLILKLEFYLEK
jgi:predicted nucleotidyltransferase component of viral defense system